MLSERHPRKATPGTGTAPSHRRAGPRNCSPQGGHGSSQVGLRAPFPFLSTISLLRSAFPLGTPLTFKEPAQGLQSLCNSLPCLGWNVLPQAPSTLSTQLFRLHSTPRPNYPVAPFLLPTFLHQWANTSSNTSFILKPSPPPTLTDSLYYSL